MLRRPLILEARSLVSASSSPGYCEEKLEQASYHRRRPEPGVAWTVSALGTWGASGVR